MNHNAHESSVSALLVGISDRDLQLMRDVFHNLGWRLFDTQERSSALLCLDRNQIHVVITEADVPGWNWKKVLHDLRERDQPPQLIVTSRNADDRLWAEALNVGAYDVLSQPFERNEVERAIDSARRHFVVQPKSAMRQRIPILAAGAA